jgi:hypothetical protein
MRNCLARKSWQWWGEGGSNVDFTVIVYELGPIDYWDGWIDLNKVSAGNFGDGEEYTSSGAHVPPLNRFHAEVMRNFEVGRQLAKAVLCFDGKISCGPFFSAIPVHGCAGPSLKVAWKRWEDGLTYVASTTPLVHLDADEVTSAHFVDGEPQVRS